jgi:hypothetical protein
MEKLIAQKAAHVLVRLIADYSQRGALGIGRGPGQGRQKAAEVLTRSERLLTGLLTRRVEDINMEDAAFLDALPGEAGSPISLAARLIVAAAS